MNNGRAANLLSDTSLLQEALANWVDQLIPRKKARKKVGNIGTLAQGLGILLLWVCGYPKRTLRPWARWAWLKVNWRIRLDGVHLPKRNSLQSQLSWGYATLRTKKPIKGGGKYGISRAQPEHPCSLIRNHGDWWQGRSCSKGVFVTHKVSHVWEGSGARITHISRLQSGKWSVKVTDQSNFFERILIPH